MAAHHRTQPETAITHTQHRHGPAPGAGAVHAEIHRQHRFLQDWLCGALPRTAEAFAPFAASTPPDATLIGTGGTRTSAPDLLQQVESAHGAAPGLAIEVGEVTVIASAGPITVASFTETHTTAEARSSRLVTAVLRRDPAAPGAFAWLHVHETAR